MALYKVSEDATPGLKAQILRSKNITDEFTRKVLFWAINKTENFSKHVLIDLGSPKAAGNEKLKEIFRLVDSNPELLIGRTGYQDFNKVGISAIPLPATNHKADDPLNMVIGSLGDGDLNPNKKLPVIKLNMKEVEATKLVVYDI